MWLVSVTRSQVWTGSRCVKFGVIAFSLSYWSLKIQHGTSRQRTLWGSEKIIVALHKDGVGYKKIAKILKLSCSTVAKTIQWFNRTGYTQSRPRHGRQNKLSACAQRHIQRLCLGNKRMSAACIAAEVEGGGGGVSLSVLRAYATHCIKLVCMAVVPEGSLFKRWCTRKPPNSLLKTSRRRTWITGTLSCGVMRPRSTYLVQTVSSMCGGNQVRSTKTSVSCLQSSIVVGVPWSGTLGATGTGELQFTEGTMNANMYCDILKQSMIPSLRRPGCRAVFQHDNDPKHTSKMTTALLKKLRVKVICGASSNGKWRSARSLTYSSSVMSSWWSGRGLQWQPAKLWWTPWLRGLRQSWKIMVATQNIDTLDPTWTFSLRGVPTFVASGLDINGCVLSYFEGTANLHCYTSCTLTTLHCRKV